MVILLAGASGLLGTALQRSLLESGRRVRQLIRRPAPPRDKVESIPWDPTLPLPPSVLEGVTAVINLGGAGIGDRRWTTKRLHTLETSRTIPTHSIASALASVDRPIRFLQASAIGFYGDTGDQAATEKTPAGETTLARLCQQWEAAAQPAIEAGHPTSFLRTGIVLSRDGGALSPILRLIKLGLGGSLGSGRQWWSWIHVDDWFAAVEFLLSADLSGPINITAPNPTTNRDLTRQLARAFTRPAVVAAPSFALRLVLGPFAEEILRDQLVVPQALTQAGFSFAYPTAAAAAQSLTR